MVTSSFFVAASALRQIALFPATRFCAKCTNSFFSLSLHLHTFLFLFDGDANLAEFPARPFSIAVLFPLRSFLPLRPINLYLSIENLRFYGRHSLCPCRWRSRSLHTISPSSVQCCKSYSTPKPTQQKRNFLWSHISISFKSRHY